MSTWRGGRSAEKRRRILHHEDSTSQTDQRETQCDESLIVCLSLFSALGHWRPLTDRSQMHTRTSLNPV